MSISIFGFSSGEIFNEIIRSRLNIREIIFRCIYFYVCMCVCICLKIAENSSEIWNKNAQQPANIISLRTRG